jgi:hypothetical protein
MSEERDDLKAIHALEAIKNEMKSLEMLRVYLQGCTSVPLTSVAMKAALFSLEEEQKRMNHLKEHNELILHRFEENWRMEVEQNYRDGMGWSSE